MLKETLYKTFYRLGYDVRRVGRRAAPDDEVLEPEFRELYERCRPFTMTSRERMYAAYSAARYVALNGVPGDIVECGVWKGGSAMIMAMALAAAGQTDRDLYLYDTFEGMVEPGEKDTSYLGESAREIWQQHRSGDSPVNMWCYSPREEVAQNLRATGYPESRIRLVKGKVEDTIPTEAPVGIALLRLDTDWYESTRHELQHLYPRLSPGGVLIIDDYGHWQGSREATDEYFATAPHRPLLTRIDATGRLAIKV